MTWLGSRPGPCAVLHPPPHSVCPGIFSARFWPAVNMFLNPCSCAGHVAVPEDLVAGFPMQCPPLRAEGLPSRGLPLCSCL